MNHSSEWGRGAMGCTHTTWTKKMAWPYAIPGNPFGTCIKKADSYLKHSVSNSTIHGPRPHPETVLFLSHICITGLHLGSLPSTAHFSTRTCPLPITPPTDWLRHFWAKPFPVKILQQSHPGYFSCLTLSMQMEQTECSKTSAYKIQTLGNHSKEIILGCW